MKFTAKENESTTMRTTLIVPLRICIKVISVGVTIKMIRVMIRLIAL